MILITLKKHMDRAMETARTSLDQARRVVHDLRPDLLEQFSLPDALKRVTDRWSEATDIKATTTITGDLIPLHPNIEVILLRAAQESLNNIHKHAQATSVKLTVSYMGDVIILDVKDNGIGLNDGIEVIAIWWLWTTGNEGTCETLWRLCGTRK